MSREPIEPRFQRDLSSPIEEHRFEIGAPDHGRRLDAFLAERMAWRSRSRIQDLVASGRVVVEAGKDRLPAPSDRLRAGSRLRAGNQVVVRLDSAFVDAARIDAREEGADVAMPAEIVVLHDDEHLLGVSKPPFVSLYPTRRHLGGSLTELVHRRHRALGLPGPPPSPCHRLDRETSGVVLFAKNRATRADVGRQFEDRTVEKTYLAIVAGWPAEDEGAIDLPLGRDLQSRVEVKQAPRLDGGGLEARTRWRVLARREGLDGGGARHAEGARTGRTAVLVVRPETGRQHQIRVHLAAIGHPILGDKLYFGGDEVFLASLDRPLHPAELAALGGLDRLALHAWRLVVRGFAGASSITIEAPTPFAWL